MLIFQVSCVEISIYKLLGCSTLWVHQLCLFLQAIIICPLGKKNLNPPPPKTGIPEECGKGKKETRWRLLHFLELKRSFAVQLLKKAVDLRKHHQWNDRSVSSSGASPRPLRTLCSCCHPALPTSRNLNYLLGKQALLWAAQDFLPICSQHGAPQSTRIQVCFHPEQWNTCSHLANEAPLSPHSVINSERGTADTKLTFLPDLVLLNKHPHNVIFSTRAAVFCCLLCSLERVLFQLYFIQVGDSNIFRLSPSPWGSHQ